MLSQTAGIGKTLKNMSFPASTIQSRCLTRSRAAPHIPRMALSLLLTGDSILQRRLNSRDDAELRPLFDKVRAADIAFTNLEGLANDYRGDPALESGGSHFGAPAWVLDELVAAGFDLFATATNHALDYSIQGLVHTIEALEARGLSFAGVGRTGGQQGQDQREEHARTPRTDAHRC